MKKINTRMAACHGKKKYLTIEAAKRSAKIFLKFTDVKLHPYHCDYCRYWHIGNPKG